MIKLFAVYLPEVSKKNLFFTVEFANSGKKSSPQREHRALSHVRVKLKKFFDTFSLVNEDQ